VAAAAAAAAAAARPGPAPLISHSFPSAAKILLQLGRRDQARDCYRQLLAINSEHHAYHAGLRQAMGLDPPAGADGRHSAEQMEGLRKLFASLSKEFPKSAAARRLALDFARGDEFEAAARDYIKRALNAAVPSLFTDLKPLYADADRAAALARIIEGFAAELAAAQRFAANEAPRSANVQAPLWALYLLAQHLDHVLDLERALQAADRAIAHTPTFIDAFVIKAQIYKVGARACVRVSRGVCGCDAHSRCDSTRATRSAHSSAWTARGRWTCRTATSTWSVCSARTSAAAATTPCAL
jgi:tetratricopeptide (TPR) repeat protein